LRSDAQAVAFKHVNWEVQVIFGISKVANFLEDRLLGILTRETASVVTNIKL
jgi:hypothetical protein